MRYAALISLLFFGLLSTGQAQNRFDLILGASPQSTPAQAGVLINRENPHDEFAFSIQKIAPQYFIGANKHFGIGEPFFTELGLVYSQRKSTFGVEYTIPDAEHPVTNQLLSQVDHIIMLPANIGVALGNFDVTSGFRALYALHGANQLSQLNGFEIEKSALQLGWQAGAGFYFGRSRLGVEYQSEFSRMNKGMTVNGHSLELMNTRGQFVLSIQQTL